CALCPVASQRPCWHGSVSHGTYARWQKRPVQFSSHTQPLCSRSHVPCPEHAPSSPQHVLLSPPHTLHASGGFGPWHTPLQSRTLWSQQFPSRSAVALFP